MVVLDADLQDPPEVIPDMLANRADTYNLGDILEGKDQLFALSYLENALTSNPVLAPLATCGGVRG